MNAWYNEIDPHAARWIEALAVAGHIAAGSVEQRSVAELQAIDAPADRQCHFFAGIGGWSRALRIAGWPDELPVWTGSCPCQPFSAAGRGQGFDDERHLWPTWFELIRERRPSIIFGEQVASPAGLAWFDAVSADLEGAGYAVGAADLCAAGVGAPHIRQRLYFVAVADAGRLGAHVGAIRQRQSDHDGGGEIGGLAVSGSERLEGIGLRLQPGRPQQAGVEAGRRCEAGELVDTGSTRSGRDTGADARAQAEGDRQRLIVGRVGDESEPTGAARELAITHVAHAINGQESRGRRLVQLASDATSGFWSPADWIECRDGKARPVEPGTFPLAHGVSGRVGRLRGYGNAIVPELAATFIGAAMIWLAGL